MKKGKITLTITIGLMCFVLVYVMFIQFKTVEETDITAIETMREAELRTELANWKSKYNETIELLEDNKSKIDEYNKKIENNQESTELIEEELEKSNLQLGKTDVKGEGVVITLVDGQNESVVALDLLLIINELKLAGAEAISINDERIINITEIVDINDYIRVNKTRLTSPIIIKAIGNQTYLESGLNSKGGVADYILDNGKSIKIEKQKNITINKYNNNIELNSIEIK